jgi:hypothetical protein
MENMKAVRVHNYGGPEVLRFEDAPRPTPGSGELLIRVHAASVQELLSRRRRNSPRSCTRDIDCLAIVGSQLRTSWAVCIMNTSWKSASPDAV